MKEVLELSYVEIEYNGSRYVGMYVRLQEVIDCLLSGEIQNRLKYLTVSMR